MEFKPVVTINLDPSHLPLRESSRGTWKKNLSEAGRGATIICGDCGNWVQLCPPPVGNHTIDNSGKVSPSVGCNQCGWHVFATLLGWDAVAAPGVP